MPLPPHGLPLPLSGAGGAFRASLDVNHSGGNPAWRVNFSEKVVALRVRMPTSGQNTGFKEKTESMWAILEPQEAPLVFSLGKL